MRAGIAAIAGLFYKFRFSIGKQLEKNLDPSEKNYYESQF